jgi:hypothetical protein
VACTELHGHINDSPGQEVIVRLVAHRRFISIPRVRSAAKREVGDCGGPQFLDSIRPTGESKKAGGNHSGIE